MVKLDKLRAGIISGDVAMWAAADRALANVNTTKYKRGVLESLMQDNPRPAGVPAPAPVAAPAATPAPAGDPAQAMRWILQANGVADTIIESCIATLLPAAVVVPAGADDEAVQEDAAFVAALDEDPVLKAQKRRARQLAAEQYDVRVLKLGKAVGFTSYIRGPLGREAIDENLRELIVAGWTPTGE